MRRPSVDPGGRFMNGLFLYLLYKHWSTGPKKVSAGSTNTVGPAHVRQDTLERGEWFVGDYDGMNRILAS